MKAPDKIYLPEEINWPSAANFTLGNQPDDIEYIRKIEYLRKDALLEWAKEKAEDYKGTANIRRSFEMMIRKIESL